ncbi:hypothetical protein MJO28_010311 [Puccinia striiformis f. sp. tritici]|uniref:Uncharacterized protein n=1 Tax=Puccinia striiformis f. sp. tritici TaxID=168172 RepID=A0ACC0E5I2_9BASI|nr:hypothetical protein MJO28_010311 [Puccinia striiformis f. sp. tritici]KAI7948392.1 hypothetical protein MJO29_010057 [Puccinia striiformis f. sp. tritici]
MFSVTNSPRGMTCILLIGMITILSITLANAHKCWDSFETEEGGYAVTPGTAACNNGITAYSCVLSSCTNKRVFWGCTSDTDKSGTLKVTGLSYTTYGDTFTVSTGPKTYVECPIKQNRGGYSSEVYLQRSQSTFTH